jgi:Beta-lactamase superfamily domain
MPSRYYSGPVSDHFDGERFFDPRGVPARSRRDLLRWFVERRWHGTKAKWPVWAPSPYMDRPPVRFGGTAWRISYVGHASFLIQTAGLNILIDPVWSKRASPSRFVGPKRVNDPGTLTVGPLIPPTTGTGKMPVDVLATRGGHWRLIIFAVKTTPNPISSPQLVV